MTDGGSNKADADGNRSAMTDQQSPTAIAELSYQKRTVVLFDDGAVVTLGDGNWWCSEHTGSPSAPPREECDHSAAAMTSTVPAFAGEMFVGAAATDRAVQDEVVSRLLENDPERLSGFAEEI